MTTISVSKSTAPNPEKLHEEIDALGIGAGYRIEYPETYPGDVSYVTAETLTAQNETDITTAITDHDETVTTSEQDRRDQDTTDLDQLITDHGNWGTMTDADKLASLKLAIRCICRIARSDAI